MSPPDDQVQRQITGFWSTVAPEYEAHPGNVPRLDSREYRAWVEAIRDLLPPAPADVLDIGTGTGFVALIAAALGHRVTAIDASSSMLDEARKEAKRRSARITFAVHDAVRPDLPPERFDAMICRHLIWTLRELERAFRSWLQLLRRGGSVIAIDGFWFEQHYNKATRTALPAMRFTAVEPIAAMFEAAGFEDVTVGDLADVHALAEEPPGSRPWYVLAARRPL